MKSVISAGILVSVMSSMALAQSATPAPSRLALPLKLEIQKLKEQETDLRLKVDQLEIPALSQLKYSGRVGNEGGGGGDPMQMHSLTSGKKDAYEKSLSRREPSIGDSDSIEEVRSQLNHLFELALYAHEMAVLLDYPGLKTKNIDFDSLLIAGIEPFTGSGEIKVKSPLFLYKNVNGKPKKMQVTFVSDPEKKSIAVDWNRFVLKYSDIRYDQRLFYDFLATALHEVFVLSRIEQSMTYTYSSGLSLFMRDLSTSNAWNGWVKNKIDRIDDCQSLSRLRSASGIFALNSTKLFSREEQVSPYATDIDPNGRRRDGTPSFRLNLHGFAVAKQTEDYVIEKMNSQCREREN